MIALIIANICLVIVLSAVLFVILLKFFGNKWCKTEGIIKDVIVKEASYASNDDGRYTVNVTTVIEYEVEGKKYTINSASFHGNNVKDITSKEKIGKPETIIYKKNNPEKGSCLFAWRVAILVIGVLLIAFILCLVILLVLSYNGIIKL